MCMPTRCWGAIRTSAKSCRCQIKNLNTISHASPVIQRQGKSARARKQRLASTNPSEKSKIDMHTPQMGHWKCACVYHRRQKQTRTWKLCVFFRACYRDCVWSRPRGDVPKGQRSGVIWDETFRHRSVVREWWRGLGERQRERNRREIKKAMVGVM